MKHLTLIALMLVNLNLFAQKSLFEEYDFSKDTYTLYFTLWWDEPSSEFSKTMLNFYIDDLTVLKELKSKWKAEKGYETLCGFDYNIYLVKNDSAVEHWLLNIECGVLDVYGECFSVDLRPLNILKNCAKPLKENLKSFSNLDSARVQLNKVRSQACIFIPPRNKDEWMDFNGVTKFERKFFANYGSSSDSLYDIMKGEIQLKFSKNKTKYKSEILFSSDGGGEVYFNVLIFTNEPLKNKAIPNYVLKEDWMKFNEIEFEYYNKKNCP